MRLDADQTVEALYRSDWGRIVATLIRLVGDFELAEEAAQEAFAAAVDRWRVDGIPEFPRAWIIQTARHKAIDRIRRDLGPSEDKLVLLDPASTLARLSARVLLVYGEKDRLVRTNSSDNWAKSAEESLRQPAAISKGSNAPTSLDIACNCSARRADYSYFKADNGSVRDAFQAG